MGDRGWGDDISKVTHLDQLSSLSAFLVRIGESRSDQFIEIRHPLPTGGMGQIFIPANEMHEATRTVLRLSKRTDVYIGAAPRSQRDGKSSSVLRLPMVWVDIDSHEGVERLRMFGEIHPPTFVVASGTPGHVHAWWLLDKSVGKVPAEIANKRLMYVLGGDPKACDAARILRPPGTLNHKTDPPLPVTMVECNPLAKVSLPELVGKLSDPPKSEYQGPRGQREKQNADPLLDILPEEYAYALADLEMGKGRKTHCPFHESESGETLHLYPDPSQGWHCFGCSRGGSIFDFAAELWGLDTRGDDFRELKRRLLVALKPILDNT